MSNSLRGSPLEDIQSIRHYLQRVGAELRAMMTAFVEENVDGYTRELARIRFTRDGKITAPSGYEPSATEAEVIGADIRATKFPERVIPDRRPPLPDVLENAEAEALFSFYDREKKFLFLQQRIDKANGEKVFIPYTFWTDGWRRAEPDDGVPLWGLEQLKQHAVVFIHEGAKAARHVRRLVEGETPDARKALADHPFGNFLANAAHIAWVTGAHGAHRTDWSALEKAGVQEVYIVTDNDEAGRAALPIISKAIRIPTLHLQFTDEWPASFDLADDFPSKFFRSVGDTNRYVGPSPRALLHPATWATDLAKVEGRNTPIPLLRQAFAGTWIYIEEPQLFVSTEVPGLALDRDALNNRYRSLSDTPRIADLILKDFRGRILGAAYRPDQPPGLLTQKDRAAYNLYRPSLIEASPGDIDPWLRFTRYLFPKEDEQHEVLRWVATLIARPDVRMKYGLLLVSETQGTGKSTFAEEVLVKIVGEHNSSFPSERDIVDSAFNPWLARKRLVVVREIYAGHSFKAYNVLKASMTEPTMYVNEKNKPQYIIDNWAHFVASSNSKKALRLEDSDRRWFYPTVTEDRWSKREFADFYEWTATGGLSAIVDWANHFNDYVGVGDHAPNTQEKDDLVAESRTPAERLAIELGFAIQQQQLPVCLSMNDVDRFVRDAIDERVYDTKDQLRRAMRTVGVHFHSDRLKLRGELHSVAMNTACYEKIKTLCPLNEKGHPIRLTDEAREFLRTKLVVPSTMGRM